MKTPETGITINVEEIHDLTWNERLAEVSLDEQVAAELRDMQVAVGEIEEAPRQREAQEPRFFDFKRGARLVKDVNHYEKRAAKSRKQEFVRELSRQAIKEVSAELV